MSPRRGRAQIIPPLLLPTSHEELGLLAQGYRLVAGLDEVGRGCLAGPVVAAAVVLPADVHWRRGDLERVRDSKQLSPEVRAELCEVVQARALSWAIGVVEADVIDEIGIVPATRRAMAAAIAGLDRAPEYLLIDYLRLREVDLPQKGITFGDSLCLSIAAASIVAKVTRDRLMEGLDGTYQGYGFCRNKGYGTPEHMAALGRLGPCPIHRRSFGPVHGREEAVCRKG